MTMVVCVGRSAQHSSGTRPAPRMTPWRNSLVCSNCSAETATGRLCVEDGSPSHASLARMCSISNATVLVPALPLLLPPLLPLTSLPTPGAPLPPSSSTNARLSSGAAQSNTHSRGESMLYSDCAMSGERAYTNMVRVAMNTRSRPLYLTGSDANCTSSCGATGIPSDANTSRGEGAEEEVPHPPIAACSIVVVAVAGGSERGE
mmetsp:Transcript_3203/g.7427  ORF Transcript_3203/g.7427 Transcript_3203/m.7427 type:complete len:204 (+) Transcript_3203:537-1148(+)